MGMRHEPCTFADPLSLMLAAEGFSAEADELASFYDAGSHRTSTVEVEKTEGDWLGASPFELDHPEYH